MQLDVQAEVALDAQRNYLFECATQETRRRDELSEVLCRDLSRNCVNSPIPSFFVLIGLFRSRSSTMLEKLRGFYFVDPNDMEFKNTMKKCANEVRKCHWNPPRRTGRTTTLSTRNPERIKLTKSGKRDGHVKLTPTNPSEKRTSEIPERDREDHIAEKGFNSSSHDDHVGKPIHIQKQ